MRKPQNEICSCEFEVFFFWRGVFQFCPIWIQLLQLYQSVKFSLALKKVPLSISFFCSTFPLTLFIIICSHNFENIIIFDTIHVSVSKRLLVAWSETLVIQLLIYIELQNSSLQHHMAQLSKRLVCCITLNVKPTAYISTFPMLLGSCLGPNLKSDFTKKWMHLGHVVQLLHCHILDALLCA